MVRELLRQGADPLCIPCLAFACSTSLVELKAITDTLLQDSNEFAAATARCDSCNRLTSTIGYTLRAKCAHCSHSIDDSDPEIVIDGDRFHQICWHILISNEHIRSSRALSRRSRELIQQSRARLRRDEGG